MMLRLRGSRLRLRGAFVFVAGALGCSAPVEDVADASGAMTQGLVVVERSIMWVGDPRSRSPSIAEGAEGAAPQTNVSAKFMRLSAAADPELAERVVGSTFERPASGECLTLDAAADEASPGLSALGPVELLDVGDITVRTSDVEMPLAARAFPDVGDLIFGVFYTSRDAASELPAPARYLFESSGSALLERFTFDADAPAGPEEVRIGELSLTDDVVLEEGVSAPVRWRADEPQDVTDRVYVDVIAASGAAMRCGFPDEGRGMIPGSMLRAQSLGSLPASVTVAVRRVREAAFVASGMDLGEVRFDLSVIGRATVVPR